MFFFPSQYGSQNSGRSLSFEITIVTSGIAFDWISRHDRLRVFHVIDYRFS